MKKRFTIMLLMTIAMTMGFNSCSDDDDKVDSLNGTTWIANTTFETDNYEEIPGTITLTFGESTFELSAKAEGNAGSVNITLKGTYSDDGKEVLLKASNGEIDYLTWSGKTLVNSDATMIFHRK